MTDDDTAPAFARPALRTTAVAGPDVPDRILLSDHVVTVDIGAFQSERGQRQRVRFNIVAELAGKGAGAGDDVDRILSYDVLTGAIAAELAAERVNLLEALAERVAARILAAPQAVRVFVRIEKLDRGPFALGVEIVRGRATAAPAQPQARALHPRVAFLPGNLTDQADLSALVDELAALGAPLILCTGPGLAPPPQAGDSRAQRRIALLAIEQQAWVLAARDPRLIVTATRTELDWGDGAGPDQPLGAVQDRAGRGGRPARHRSGGTCGLVCGSDGGGGTGRHRRAPTGGPRSRPRMAPPVTFGFRAVPRTGAMDRAAAMYDTDAPLAGSSTVWFHGIDIMRDGHKVEEVLYAEVNAEVQQRLSAPRAPLCGLTLDRPRIMGILNVTPDSFSDGGDLPTITAALARARAMARHADILDVGGESTRPGAATIPVAEEIARTAPVIRAIRDAGITTPISIDTRKAAVAAAALDAGANMVNDVSGLAYDPAMAALVAERAVPLCLMHAQGDPATMQDDPRYDNVLWDVYTWLAARVRTAHAAGIRPDRIVIDPGIGFGKTLQHNLTVLRGLSLYHDIGCPLLLGASRKRFIGTIGKADLPQGRMPGSLAVALHGAAQGAHVLRVHDVAETRQALSLQQALNGND